MFKTKNSLPLLLSLVTALVIAGPVLSAKQKNQALPLTNDQLGGVQAYLTMYPSMSRTDAEVAVRGQRARFYFLRDIGKSERETFGGSRYDSQTNTQYIYATTLASQDRILAEGRNRGINVVVELVPYSYKDLEIEARAINASRTKGEAANRAFFAVADSYTNRVAVIVKDDIGLSNARTLFANNPRVAVEKELQGFEAKCSTRIDCGAPLRSGVNFGHDRDGAGPYRASSVGCTMGFTAKASDGSRWALSAGHCAEGVQSACYDYNPDGCWGHGQQYIGPEREALYYDNVDVLRARIDNSYWKNSPGGYMYNSASPDILVEVDDDATARTQIQYDDWVCFQGRRNDEAPKANPCGLVKDLTGTRGMVQVNGYAVCQGDSGGGAYTPNAKHSALSGRAAFGIIWGVSSYDRCHSNSPDVWSAFSALPDIYYEWDWLNPATIRVETR